MLTKPSRLGERMKLSSHAFLLFIPFFLFLIFPKAISCNTSLIDRVCKNCSLTDHNISYHFCRTSIQAAPGSRCARLRGLGLMAIRLVLDSATETHCVIKELLRKKGLPPGVKARLLDCLELYSDGVDSLTWAIEKYRNGNYSDANAFISSAMTSASTCEDGFHEMEALVSPLTKQNDDAFELGAISLSIMNMQKK